MNQIQLARFKAYTVALAHLKQNEEITKDVPAFAKVYDNIKALLDGIKESNDLIKQNRLAISAGKYQYKAEIGQQALTIAAALVTYAVSTGDEQLKESMNFTRSELFHVSDQDLAARATNILTTANMLAEPLKEYGVTAEMITKLEQLAAQYLPEANGPRTHTARRKNAAQQISEQIAAAKDLMDNQLDKLMIQFQLSHPEFYNQYTINRTVVSPSHRKTRLEGMVTGKDTRTGLAGVQVALKDTTLVTTTGADGSYSLKMRPVTGATVAYYKEGYAPVSLTLEVKRGQAVNQPVEMEKL